MTGPPASATRSPSITSRPCCSRAITVRKDDSGRAIRFDADSLNPRLEYYDEQGRNHKVWFLDGVTAFNQWSLAQKTGIRGAAVWMLGSEDPSMWNVLGKGALFAPQKLDALEKINFPYEVEFVGEGEILSIHAEPRIGDSQAEGRSLERALRRVGIHPASLLLRHPAPRLSAQKSGADLRRRPERRIHAGDSRRAESAPGPGDVFHLRR